MHSPRGLCGRGLNTPHGFTHARTGFRACDNHPRLETFTRELLANRRWQLVKDQDGNDSDCSSRMTVLGRTSYVLCSQCR
jgi:hypothetical protein